MTIQKNIKMRNKRREKWEPLWMRCINCQHEFIVVIGDVDWFKTKCPVCGTTSEFERRRTHE